MRKIVFAPDSFKESMTAKVAAEAMIRGWKRVFPDDDCIAVPMADGGEGTVQSLVDATGGRLLQHTVQGPLGDPVVAHFGLLGDGETAVIEMAQASGLERLSPERRNPMITSTYGTGELIKKALDAGAKTILIGIGGSATNDGGAGMLRALGAVFTDKDGKVLSDGGAALAQLARIDISGLDARIAATEFVTACDVDNPLTGPTGASAIFGPQKGATEEMVARLDAALANYAAVIQRDFGRAVNEVPGAGAAGGLGAGLLAFLDAELKRGVEIVIEQTKLKEKMSGADLVLTGEGGIDAQTRFGKTPYGVAKTAEPLGIPVIALAGLVKEDSMCLYEHGFAALFSIVQGATSLEDALRRGEENLAFTTENLARLFAVKNTLRERK